MGGEGGALPAADGTHCDGAQGLDYVDLMLVHFPASWSNVGGKAGRVEEWKAMEKFYKVSVACGKPEGGSLPQRQAAAAGGGAWHPCWPLAHVLNESRFAARLQAGKAKALGVSHYCERHVDDILEVATVKPAVNQVRAPAPLQRPPPHGVLTRNGAPRLPISPSCRCSSTWAWGKPA